MKIEISVMGGNVYQVLNRTPNFPEKLESMLRNTFQGFSTSNALPTPLLRFAPVGSGYVFSVVSTRMDGRLSYYFHSYFMDQEMADQLLSISWVGLAERMKEFIELDILAQQNLLQTKGWGPFQGSPVSKPAAGERFSQIFGAYLCASGISSKICFTMPMEKTVTQMLGLLPLELRRNLSFCGPVTTAGQACGVKLYFATEENARAMDAGGNEGGELVNVIPCSGGQLAIPGYMAKERELVAQVERADVPEEVWDRLLCIFPRGGSWEQLFRLVEEMNRFPQEFKALVKNYGGEQIAKIIRSDSVSPAQVQILYQQYGKLIKGNPALLAAFTQRMPELAQATAQAETEGKKAPAMIRPAQGVSGRAETEHPETGGEKQNPPKPDGVGTPLPKKKPGMRRITRILVDGVLAVLLLVLLIKTVVSPLVTETSGDMVMITLETAGYLQSTLVAVILAFFGGVVVARLVRNLRK